MNPIGKQIRSFRLRANLTQEKLAEQLNVTAQSISKWETSAGYPDITLLPSISNALGVTIDELFDYGCETHIQRIEQMLDNENIRSEADFQYAEEHLKKGTLIPGKKSQCLTLLSRLYNQRADTYRSIAAEYARSALELDPEEKENHSLLFHSMQGPVWDWCCTNHTALIEYYSDFVRLHPDYAGGYLWYLDALITDGRLTEAKTVLEEMHTVRESYHYLLYKGWIEEKDGHRELADRIWDEMVAAEPDNWFVHSSRADTFAKRGDYRNALRYFYQAAGLETAPRYTDNWLSIAQICEILKQPEEAVRALEQVLVILRDDWNIIEGNAVEEIQTRIHKLSLGVSDSARNPSSRK